MILYRDTANLKPKIVNRVDHCFFGQIKVEKFMNDIRNQSYDINEWR